MEARRLVLGVLFGVLLFVGFYSVMLSGVGTWVLLGVACLFMAGTLFVLLVGHSVVSALKGEDVVVAVKKRKKGKVKKVEKAVGVEEPVKPPVVKNESRICVDCGLKFGSYASKCLSCGGELK